MSVQFIEKNGKPEWAVLSYVQYLHLVELSELVQDLQDFKMAQAQGIEELLPQDFADRLIAGENPIRVWREYRKLTQGQLAKMAKISVPYLSQIENGERKGAVTILKRLAAALKITLNDIV